jgi:N-methylhydantoinase B
VKASNQTGFGDPITFEVVKNALRSVADEMAITVVRTAHSQVIRESMDFSTGLCDASGRLIAQGVGIPVQLGALPDAVQFLLRKYDRDIHPGDVFILNDPDEGGMHLPDLFVFRPVFRGDFHVGFAACVAHYADIGGRTPGGNAVDSTEIFQEGLQIPIVKLYERGRENRAIFEVLARNVRIPETVLGDLQAQLAATRIGEAGLLRLFERYGNEGFAALIEELLDYTERRVRSELARIAPGVYAFEDYIDNDGFGSGPIPIKVSLTIAGGQVLADFTGTSAQVKSALNATLSFTKSAVYTALRCVMQDDIPGNAGFFRPITVTAPVGTIVNPIRPAPRAARGLTGFRMVETVLGALHQALPDRVPAAGEGAATMISFSGHHGDGRPFVHVEFSAGGWGGRPDRDGVDGTSCIEGNISNVPVEEVELNQPLRVEQYGFVPDTGGPGTWRGCISVVRDFRLLADEALLHMRSDRRQFLPYGLNGGRSGTPSWNILNPGTVQEEVLPTHVTRLLRRGDVIRHMGAGGGGFGDPLDRDPQDVLADVREGKLSAKYVRENYAVELSGDGTAIDLGRTADLRAERRRSAHCDALPTRDSTNP